MREAIALPSSGGQLDTCLVQLPLCCMERFTVYPGFKRVTRCFRADAGRARGDLVKHARGISSRLYNTL